MIIMLSILSGLLSGLALLLCIHGINVKKRLDLHYESIIKIYDYIQDLNKRLNK